MTGGKPTRAADVVAYLSMLAVAAGVAALLQSLMTLTDCNPYPCAGLDLWGPRLAWLVTLAYGLAGAVRLAVGWRRSPAEPLWPWMLTFGAIAASIVAATCFAIVGS